MNAFGQSIGFGAIDASNPSLGNVCKNPSCFCYNQPGTGRVEQDGTYCIECGVKITSVNLEKEGPEFDVSGRLIGQREGKRSSLKIFLD